MPLRTATTFSAGNPAAALGAGDAAAVHHDLVRGDPDRPDRTAGGAAPVRGPARARLLEIGRLQREERKRQQVWEIRDPHFSHLIIQFDKAKLVHFVTAVAREDAQRERMRYSDVAELKNARQTGEAAKKNYRYEWGLEAAGKDPKIHIVAWGRDPQYLQYYSIERAN